MIQYKKIKQISPELTLSYYNQIPVLELNHPHLGEAKVALQGAQLLSWKPKSEQQDILWLSPIEPFCSGKRFAVGYLFVTLGLVQRKSQYMGLLV